MFLSINNGLNDFNFPKLSAMYESFASWLFVLELIWKRWRGRLFCRHQPRPGKVFVAKSGSSPPGAASHSSINKEKSEQSGNVEDFSTPRKTILWYIENYNANTYLVSKVAGPGILRIKTLRGIFPAKELSALWKRFQHTLINSLRFSICPEKDLNWKSSLVLDEFSGSDFLDDDDDEY